MTLYSFVEPLRDVDAGGGAAETLVRPCPQTPPRASTIGFELDHEKGIEEVLAIGHHFFLHRSGLLVGGMLLDDTHTANPDKGENLVQEKTAYLALFNAYLEHMQIRMFLCRWQHQECPP